MLGQQMDVVPVSAALGAQLVDFGHLHTRDDGMKEPYVANVTADGQPTTRTGIIIALDHCRPAEMGLPLRRLFVRRRALRPA